MMTRAQAASRREAVRFVSCSQPMAGAFLNAVPKYEAFRLPSWAMRIAVQRRLGLPLLASAAAGEIFGKTKITGGTRMGSWSANKMELVFFPPTGELRIWWTMS